MFNTGYPTANFNWAGDNSGASTDVLFSAQTDGLNVPFQFIMAERGQPGQIYFGGAAELTPILGAATFDESSPYFNPATRFLGTAMAGQGVEVMRLVDPAATSANMGLFISVTNVDVPQYQKDIHGARVLDQNGNFVPLMTTGASPVPVTNPGIKVVWSVRALTNQETFSTLTTTTTGTAPNTTTTYPVMGFQVDSPGKYGNRQGFTLYSSGTDMAAVATDINSIVYRLIPMALPTNVSTTASPIPDLFGADYNDISFKDVAVYSKTATNYALKYVLGNSYVNNTTGQNSLPYDVHSYGANIGTVGTALITLTSALAGTDPYLIDLISGKDLNGNYYDNLEIDASSLNVVNSAVTNFASGGSDGDTSFTMLQTQIQNWLNGSDHGEFTNLQQHPMTHFSDPGFSMATKVLLFNMLDMRDNFKIDVSTQDVSLAPNTKAQDLSAGQALLFRAQMHPESIINGVGCTRVGIYAHAGNLITASPYSGLTPFNLNRLIQRRNLDGGTYIKGSSGGRPNSEVTIFRKANWVADDDTTNALFWAGAINVVRHATRTTIFYPSLRTVYPNDTSLLSDDEISDRIIYMFKICRAIWSIYAGVRQVQKKLFPRIETDINNDCATAFSGDNIAVTAKVFQTAYDANLGYQTSVNLGVTGNLPMRVLNFNVGVGRSAA